jgi:hypothetical protein
MNKGYWQVFILIARQLALFTALGEKRETQLAKINPLSLTGKSDKC